MTMLVDRVPEIGIVGIRAGRARHEDVARVGQRDADHPIAGADRVDDRLIRQTGGNGSVAVGDQVGVLQIPRPIERGSHLEREALRQVKQRLAPRVDPLAPDDGFNIEKVCAPFERGVPDGTDRHTRCRR